jgi:uncharacterized protein YjiS (DUF1127 family)
MAYMNIAQVAEGGLRDRISALVKTYHTAAARRAIYRQTVRELDALSDRELADLGIARSMITRIALDAANAN